MRSGILIRDTLSVLLAFFLLALSLQGLAGEQAEDDSDAEAAGTSTKDTPFWPAWNKFVADITQSNLNGNPDPWEGLNRKIFAFNDTADRWVLKPVAKGYRWVMPDPLETGVSNVFSNLFEVTTIVNDLLQLKFTQAGADTGRFLINSTVGLAGLFDVASPLGLKKNNEDFGQTLGYWGVGSGPYIVVPFLGSYTLRSGTGSIIESQTVHYTLYIDHIRTRNQVYLASVIDRRASLLSAEELITGDRYSFIRDAYLQRREFLLNDGKVEDSFGDQDFEDWDDWE